MGMNINLTSQLKKWCDRRLHWLYTSASEVVREALRLMEEKDQVRAAKLEQLRNDIQEGVNNSPATAWDAKDIKRIGQVKGRGSFTNRSI
jgi:antitoxin ParD1/3/4